MDFKPAQNVKRRPVVNEVVRNWNAGYMSYADAIRARKGVLTDMTNMELVQDGIPRIRPGLTRYGSEALGEIIGIGKYTKATGIAKPERWEISMQVIDDKGQICIRKDGGSWQVVGGDYDPTAWTTFTQSNNRVYMSNRSNAMSYMKVLTLELVTYTAIAAPATPTLTQTGLGGTAVVTYRVRVSANNNVGETMASVAATITVSAYRNAWDPNTQSISIETGLVTGAESYNFYIGTSAGAEQYLGNMPKPSSGTVVTFKDNNRAALNPFKVAPEGNSTEGPVLGTMVTSSGQLFGLDDKNNPYRYWYSGTGDKAGDFSPFNGGGWVDINLGGDSLPVAVKPFRDGKGTSAITILTKGAAGAGEVYHQTFESQALGDYTITYPLIVAANGQSGTYGAMAVVEANNALHYPTGTAFKTTGTKAQMVNILVTTNTSDTILPDVQRLNLGAMDGAVGMEYENRIFWALPVGADHNNEIWIQDLSRNGAWILRWTIAAKYMWLYEDNSGKTHHCVLTDNKILEFNRSAASEDDGVPFRSRLAGHIATFDESGLQMAAIEMRRFLLIRPQGKININIYGLGEDGEAITGIANEEINPAVDPTGWSDMEWSQEEWSAEIGPVGSLAKSIIPVPIEVDETVCQLSYDIVTETAGCDYVLHSEQTVGKLIPGLFYGDD